MSVYDGFGKECDTRIASAIDFTLETMNIAFAQTFLEVVSTGSFALAAERLNVTNSAVTMRIKALESHLGKLLLIRSKAGVSLTAEGARFLRHAEAMVRAWQVMKRQMTLAPGFETELSIGTDPYIFEGFVANWVVSMRELHPHIAVRCETASSDRLTEMVFQGWLDLCLTCESQPRDGIKYIHLFDDPLVLVSTEDRERVDWDPKYIEVEWGSSYSKFVDENFDITDKTPIIHVSQFLAGLSLVQKFGGSIYVPERYLRSNNLKRPLYPVKGIENIHRRIYLGYSVEAMESRHAKISLDDFKASVLAAIEMTPQ